MLIQKPKSPSQRKPVPAESTLQDLRLPDKKFKEDRKEPGPIGLLHFITHILYYI